MSVWLYLCNRLLSPSPPHNFKSIFKHSQPQIWWRSRNLKEVLTSHMKIGSWVKKDNPQAKVSVSCIYEPVSCQMASQLLHPCFLFASTLNQPQRLLLYSQTIGRWCKQGTENLEQIDKIVNMRRNCGCQMASQSTESWVRWEDMQRGIQVQRNPNYCCIVDSILEWQQQCEGKE